MLSGICGLGMPGPREHGRTVRYQGAKQNFLHHQILMTNIPYFKKKDTITGAHNVYQSER